MHFQRDGLIFGAIFFEHKDKIIHKIRMCIKKKKKHYLGHDQELFREKNQASHYPGVKNFKEIEISSSYIRDNLKEMS